MTNEIKYTHIIIYGEEVEEEIWRILKYVNQYDLMRNLYKLVWKNI